MSYRIVTIILLTLLFLATGCQSDQHLTSKIDKAAPDKSQYVNIYTKDDLAKIYNDLKVKSFPDTPEDSMLLFEDLSPAFALAHPLSLNMIIDIDRLNKYRWPRDAVTGLIAHELAHMVTFQKRSFHGRLFLIWDYPFSVTKRRALEHEADQIAIDRGYGKQLVQARIYQFRIDDDEYLDLMMGTFYWPETLQEMISKQSQAAE